MADHHSDSAHSDNALSENAARIATEETAALVARTPGSQALHERASKHLPYGVASTFHANDPYPIYLERGQGSHVWDVDGTEYLDFHGGFGVNVVGHAHPKVVEAIERAARTGTHFATTTPTTVALAEELCRRFHLDTVRFTNSGTEATMDAIRIARAATGRDRSLKIEGSYHGHHDTVMFSVVPNADAMGGRDQPASTPMSKGIPAVLADYTLVVPFNDVEALDRMLERPRLRDRLPDHGAGDDEHRRGGPAARLPRGGPRPLHAARRRADLRRGEVGRDDRRRWRDRAVRRAAAPRVLRQGHRRRHPHRRVRRRRVA